MSSRLKMQMIHLLYHQYKDFVPVFRANHLKSNAPHYSPIVDYYTYLCSTVDSSKFLEELNVYNAQQLHQLLFGFDLAVNEQVTSRTRFVNKWCTPVSREFSITFEFQLPEQFNGELLVSQVATRTQQAKMNVTRQRSDLNLLGDIVTVTAQSQTQQTYTHQDMEQPEDSCLEYKMYTRDLTSVMIMDWITQKENQLEIQLKSDSNIDAIELISATIQTGPQTKLIDVSNIHLKPKLIGHGIPSHVTN